MLKELYLDSSVVKISDAPLSRSDKIPIHLLSGNLPTSFHGGHQDSVHPLAGRSSVREVDLAVGQHAPKGCPLPKLHDLDQPFIFDISMYNRPYRFEFYDTSSPGNYTLLQPDFVILCFDVTDRRSLINVPQVWRKDVTRHYKKDGDDPPLMMLGLKRDARVEDEGVIYPQEVRGFMAITGELVSEVFEDIARTAAKTKTDAGGLTQGGCMLM
ncbi:MAG: hypothetical protein Q9226_001473 [Calogaya cf. arnoldii]